MVKIEHPCPLNVIDVYKMSQYDRLVLAERRCGPHEYLFSHLAIKNGSTINIGTTIRIYYCKFCMGEKTVGS